MQFLHSLTSVVYVRQQERNRSVKKAVPHYVCLDESQQALSCCSSSEAVKVPVPGRKESLFQGSRSGQSCGTDRQ